MKKILIILVVIFSVLYVANYVVSPKIKYEKIIDMPSLEYNKQTLESSGDNDLMDDVVIVQAYLEYESFGSAKKNYKNIRLSDHKEKKEKFRNDAKDYHHGNNNKLIKGIDFGNYQELYVSKYSPFIDITYDYNYFMNHKDSILSNITKCKYIKEVRINQETIYNQNMTYTMRGCDAETVYTNRTKTGNGVIVGILEPGVIKTNDALLANVDITIRSSVHNLLGKSDHTTGMAQLIAGSTGVAPDVSLLNAYLYGTMSEEMDWMIDHGADIVNMSFSENGNFGTYSTVAAYADYIAYTYDIILVASAGNRGQSDGYIGNPGLGYNVITVGSADYTGPSNSFSSYITEVGPIKPTICVDGNEITISEDLDRVTGTSVSAALCSGLIALLLEDYPNLVVEKEKLIALMVANAKDSIFYNYNQGNGFDLEVGAGLFSYQNIIDHYNTVFVYDNSTGQANTTYKSRQIYLQEGQTLRASFVHLAKADGTTSGTEFTDYDIYIRNPQNEVLKVITDASTNVMMVSYEAPSTGYYKLEFRQFSELKDIEDHVAFAYGVYN